MVTEEEFNQLKETVTALDARISSLEGLASVNPVHAHAKAETDTKQEDQNPEVKIDAAELLYVKDLKFVQDKCLAVLDYVFRKYPMHPGLKPAELETILREKFAIPTSQFAISMALKTATGTYVTREKASQGYQYKILQKGQEHITEQIKTLNP